LAVMVVVRVVLASRALAGRLREALISGIHTPHIGWMAPSI